MAFDIGNPLIPIHDLPYIETPAIKNNPLAERITRALYHLGFIDIGVSFDDNELWIEAQNDRYLYATIALGVIIRTASAMTPENIHTIHIILKENNIPQLQFTTIREDIMDFSAEKLSPKEFFYLSHINTELSSIRILQTSYKKQYKYGIKPSFESFLNDPSGFFKYRLGITGWFGYYPWKGATFLAGLEGYPLNNVSTVNTPLSIPVRSDIALYKEENIGLGRLLYNQTYKMKQELYGRVTAGYLEIQYGGIDAEIAKPLFDGRIVLGLSGSLVKKRDTENPFTLKENPAKDIFSTAFLNTRINIPEKDIALDIKTGRFLAGDYGARFSISKNIKGVILSAWYTITDTSVFDDDVNSGYRDKGISISIPIRLFKGSDSRTRYTYTVTPWTRDTGQDIDHFMTLFDFIGRKVKILLNKDKKMIY
jgi:hypothetical protein